MGFYDVVTVTVVFSREPGGPQVTVSDAVEWVETVLSGDGEPEGFNSLRYSRHRVVSASLIEGKP